jgi:hypothetical protein
VHALWPHDPVARVDFCNYQSVNDGETNPELTFYTDKARFYMNGHVAPPSRLTLHITVI